MTTPDTTVGISAILITTDAELELLRYHYELEASKWGINPEGVLESPELYNAAVYRQREIEEIQQAVRTAREAKTAALAEQGLNEQGLDAGSAVLQ